MKPSLALPAIDWQLAKTLSPSLSTLVPGAGKDALALALLPFPPLLETIRLNAKTGFGVPTGNWISRATGSANLSTKGQASLERLRLVLKGPVTQSIACVA